MKLSDFGIAKAATHSSVFYRVRGQGRVHVARAGPRPARSTTAPTSIRSAVCLYEALTFERLFIGDLSTPADAIYSQPIVPPSKKRPGLPAALDVVLATALAIDPDDRYQDAVAFAEALRQVAHRHGLLFSAPQLAEHLRSILGRDPLDVAVGRAAGRFGRSVHPEASRQGARGQGGELDRARHRRLDLVRRRLPQPGKC